MRLCPRHMAKLLYRNSRNLMRNILFKFFYWARIIHNFSFSVSTNKIKDLNQMMVESLTYKSFGEDMSTELFAECAPALSCIKCLCNFSYQSVNGRRVTESVSHNVWNVFHEKNHECNDLLYTNCTPNPNF